MCVVRRLRAPDRVSDCAQPGLLSMAGCHYLTPASEWWSLRHLLATSLFGDLAAGLYEDASARLREHPALIRVLSLAPGRRPGGHLDLPAADKELPGWPTRSRNVTACGAMPLLIRRYAPIRSFISRHGIRPHNGQFCVAAAETICGMSVSTALA